VRGGGELHLFEKDLDFDFSTFFNCFENCYRNSNPMSFFTFIKCYRALN